MKPVLDASTALAWLFDDEVSPEAHAVLGQIVVSGAVVPAIWRLEIANVFQNAVRRGRCDRGFAEGSFERLRRLPLETDIATDDQTWRQTFDLALTANITVYDADYLELAIRRQTGLATLDRALAKAANERGVKLLAGG